MDVQFHDETRSADELNVEEEENPNDIRLGIIADVEVTLGFLLAGVGYTSGNFCNYLMVDKDTEQEELESFFHTLYSRYNIGIILVDYDSARRLQAVIAKCSKLLPVIVVVPTKETLLLYLEKKDKTRRQLERDEI